MAGARLTKGGLALLVEGQQDKGGELEEQLTELARQVTALQGGAGGGG